MHEYLPPPSAELAQGGPFFFYSDVPFEDAAPAPQTHQLSFTGSGREYFKIWIVNLFLSVVTLGIYSAWAKVRRLQYFDRNTHLAGAVFDFDGDPKAIFRGRVLAVILLAAYHYAFGFSVTIGLIVIGTLMVSLPFLMRGALRFRMRNTRYRGLRFGFTGAPVGAYLAYVPPLLIFLLPAALVAVDPSGSAVALVFLLYLVWPLMHGAMKRYQHGNVQFGSLASHFDIPKRRFYGPYLKSIGWGMVFMFIVGAVAALVMAGWIASQKGPNPAAALMGGLLGIAVTYLLYLLTGPYLQVRLNNMTWSGTSLPGLRIDSHMQARAYIKLQLVNSLLTVLSLGLYRPFAVVRNYRYRIENVTVTTEGSFERAVAAVAVSGSAGADGVADFLGVDLSW
ncbi:MAG: YjgN family protein [Massilia sp.]